MTAFEERTEFETILSHELQIERKTLVAREKTSNVSAPPRSIIGAVHQIARDENSSHLLSFPFTFAVLILLTIGLALIGCGLVVPDAWTALGGFLLTLFGSVLYGWALCDEVW